MVRQIGGGWRAEPAESGNDFSLEASMPEGANLPAKNGAFALRDPQRMSPECMVFVIDDDSLVRESILDLIGSVNLPVQGFGSTDEFMASERPDVPACLI